ncbi:response regulator transcription factor [Nocardioides bizhenqiangii]|uniref:Response regulator transcription factor n=1 Tax=Nocardioides bizhenqiangii TaxID=3095076 RepID=A0ABZ0ZRK7_9ACTN|nr:MULTISPECIES: response regulator transcription factor [unclassified Nocardioides]MDZ5619886.1 response regulator transcription factor [Nocardioides sp. HM23]WQQ26108.1 response regulator transcription factor [Nocardioides sp. HM61]
MINVLIADDQGMIRAGLRSLLEQDSEICVVGEAADGLDAVTCARRMSPDVVLMDIRMPELDGIEATRRLLSERRETRVLMLTTFDLDEYVFDALRAGASGFLLKDAPAEDLVDAVHVLARGDALLAPAVTRRVIELFATTPVPTAPRELALLSPRELEVLRLLATGRSNAEIAENLFVSDATVKTHVSSVLSKLGIRDRVQAVIYAYEAGLVRPG